MKKKDYDTYILKDGTEVNASSAGFIGIGLDGGGDIKLSSGYCSGFYLSDYSKKNAIEIIDFVIGLWKKKKREILATKRVRPYLSKPATNEESMCLNCLNNIQRTKRKKAKCLVGCNQGVFAFCDKFKGKG